MIAFFSTAFDIVQAAITVDIVPTDDNVVCAGVQSVRRLIDEQRHAFSVVVQVDIDKAPSARSLGESARQAVHDYDASIDMTTFKESIISVTDTPTTSPTTSPTQTPPTFRPISQPTFPPTRTQQINANETSVWQSQVFLGIIGGLGGLLCAALFIGIYMYYIKKQRRAAYRVSTNTDNEASDADRQASYFYNK